MKQDTFSKQHDEDWQALHAGLTSLYESSARARKTRDDVSSLPRLYRNACHHLSLSRSRAYSPQLIERLSRLVLKGHQALYSNRPNIWQSFVKFIVQDYPRLFRQQWGFMLAASLLFFGSFLLMLVIVQLFPQMVYTVIDPWQVRGIEAMYTPEAHARLGPSRGSESDFLMFGFYIKNNTGIGFQTFAGGLVFGLGTLFYLLYNGLMIGATAGHLTGLGYIDTFWGFVSGHSAPELTAIMLSGAAGLMLGWALLSPGNKSRLRALQDAGQQAVKIVYGAAMLFFLAAFIEAFWSSMTWIEPTIKYIVGISLWVMLWGYLLLAGKASTLDRAPQ
jgi:uncharacterized membrane protein SpoIIM required for sporulation